MGIKGSRGEWMVGGDYGIDGGSARGNAYGGQLSPGIALYTGRLNYRSARIPIPLISFEIESSQDKSHKWLDFDYGLCHKRPPYGGAMFCTQVGGWQQTPAPSSEHKKRALRRIPKPQVARQATDHWPQGQNTNEGVTLTRVAPFALKETAHVRGGFRRFHR
jgi:hypothetical protein